MLGKTLKLVILSCFCLNLQAQIPVGNNAQPFFYEIDSQKIFVRIANQNFFKNNEYFDPINEGVTWIGFHVQPSLVYQAGKNTRFEAGASFLKYSGREGFSDVQPILRFQYQPTATFQMVMGTIFGGSTHGLIEPLYQWERNFTEPIENGLQFLFKTSRITADVWLEWEKFIFRNDPFQEELTVGTTFSAQLLPDDRSFNLSVPLQLLVNHHGGQGIGIDLPLQTHVNYAGGLVLHRKFSKPSNKISAELWYIGYNDLSPQKLQAFQDGFALYPKFGLTLNGFLAQAGYFYGRNFISPSGEPLLLSAVTPYSGVQYPEQKRTTLKLAYHKNIDKGISLTVYSESYLNMNSGNADYNYGVHIIFDRDFFIAKVK